MRQGLPALLLALSPALFSASALASGEDVASIEKAISTKHSEISTAAAQVQDTQLSVRQLRQDLVKLETQSNQLDNRRRKAKQALDRQYSLMLDNPDLDIAATQQAYQDAWAEVKHNQQFRLEKEQLLQEQQAKLAGEQAQSTKLKAQLNELSQNHLRARAVRLQAELRQQDDRTVQFTNRCAQDMTLAQCGEQTKNLGLQKAVNQFQSELLASTTEAKVIKQHIANTTLNIHVLNHKVKDAGFYDGGRFKTVLQVALEARPAKNAACKLLNIDSGYCFEQSDLSLQEKQQQEVRWVNLTVRSNQHQDKVMIDGVNYGSTPVDIMLPTGAHMITVEKEGYRSFHQELSVRGDHTLRAVLREKQNLPQAGEAFADQLKSGTKAPKMVVITEGEYLIGENGSQQINLDHAFAIAATPITVDQFSTFVNQTGYQSDAELKKLCSTIDNAIVVPVKDSYWRNPGFKQNNDYPAVCLSRNDALAYAKWLSKQTGHQYRLPSAAEWEIAARAGSKSAFWWGSSFGTGQANTGWSGTPWSNNSTSPVKSFPANQYGLYDMVGNVWEWTDSSQGIVKGGAWSFAPAKAAAHESLSVSPNMTANYVGFRVIRELNR